MTVCFRPERKTHESARFATRLVGGEGARIG